MLILYDDPISGNGYKVWLLLAQLGIPYDLIELDILKQETRMPAFLRKNPNGRIPTIAFDDGRYLSESNAILFYFAQGTPYWPEDRYDQADVVRTIQPLTLCGRGAVPASFARSAGSRAVGRKHEKSYAALNIMEQHLGARDYFVADQYTIADIALYAYTHVAEKGKFDLSGYPNIRSWLDRVRERPGHVAMGVG